MDDSRIASATLDHRIGQVSLNGRQPRIIMYRQTTDDCRSHDLTSRRSHSLAASKSVLGFLQSGGGGLLPLFRSDGDTESLVASDSAVD